MSFTADELISSFAYAPALEKQFKSLMNKETLGNAYLLYGEASSPLEELACGIAQTFCALYPSLEYSQNQGKVLKNHPDIQVLQAQGSQGYLNEQIQDIIEEAQKAPFYSQKKFFIITNADKLGVSCANAFLKTLEEPTQSTCFILLTHDKSLLLDTIVSRCLSIYVPPEPLDYQLESLRSKAEVNALQAYLALASQGGDQKRALNFLSDTSAQEVQALFFEFLEQLSTMPDYRIIEYGAKLALALGHEDERLKQEHKEQMIEQKDFLSSALSKKLEQQYKRELSIRAKERIRSLASYAESLALFMEYSASLEHTSCSQVSAHEERSLSAGMGGIKSEELERLGTQLELWQKTGSELREELGKHSCTLWVYLRASDHLKAYLASKAKTMSFSQIETLGRAPEVLEKAIAYNTSVESSVDDMLYTIREAFTLCKE